MGTLYVVSTPIGNLEDISLRALRVLREVRLIAAEDTREARKLLAHYDIHTPLISYHAHNERARVDPILAALAEGDVALVSDAGTPDRVGPRPGVDPGGHRGGLSGDRRAGAGGRDHGADAERLGYGALSLPGLLAAHGQGAAARCWSRWPGSPGRWSVTRRRTGCGRPLADLLAVLGDRPCAVARELTKLHEEVRREPLSAALAHFTATPPRGEFTLVVDGAPAAQPRRTRQRRPPIRRRKPAPGWPRCAAGAALPRGGGPGRRSVGPAPPPGLQALAGTDADQA